MDGFYVAKFKSTQMLSQQQMTRHLTMTRLVPKESTKFLAKKTRLIMKQLKYLSLLQRKRWEKVAVKTVSKVQQKAMEALERKKEKKQSTIKQKTIKEMNPKLMTAITFKKEGMKGNQRRTVEMPHHTEKFPDNEEEEREVSQKKDKKDKKKKKKEKEEVSNRDVMHVDEDQHDEKKQRHSVKDFEFVRCQG